MTDRSRNLDDEQRKPFCEACWAQIWPGQDPDDCAECRLIEQVAQRP